MHSPERIFIIGFMGSGKSSTGRFIAAKTGFEFVDLDTAVELEYGQDITTIFEVEGENYFRQLEEKILKSLQHKKNIVIATGGGTPCYSNNMEWMNANGLTIYLETHPGILFHRLAPRKTKRPLIAKLTDVELMEFILDRLAAREGFYQQAAFTIDSANNRDEILKKIFPLAGSYTQLEK